MDGKRRLLFKTANLLSTKIWSWIRSIKKRLARWSQALISRATEYWSIQHEQIEKYGGSIRCYPQGQRAVRSFARRGKWIADDEKKKSACDALVFNICIIYSQKKNRSSFFLSMFVLRSRHRHNDDTRKKTQVHVRRWSVAWRRIFIA